MSCNFYNTTGLMVGMDPHKYWALTPEGIPAELIAGYANIAQYWANPVEEPGTKTARLTSDGHRMIQGKCKLTLVLHWPVIIPAPPYPLFEPVEIGITIIFSSTVPILRRQSVTGHGQPLAICVTSAVGANLNCAEPVKTPTGMVLNLSSVKTEASLADIAPAVIDWVIDVITSKLVKGLSKKFLEKYFKKVADEVLRRIVKKIAEEPIKLLVKELLKKGKEKAKELLRDLGVPLV